MVDAEAARTLILVTIEMCPKGDRRAEVRRHLGTIEIWNDLSADNIRTRGNYGARLSRRSQPDSTWKSARVTGFPRKALGAYDLLYRVLREVVGSRNESGVDKDPGTS